MCLYRHLESLSPPCVSAVADLYSLRAHLHFVHNQLEERIAQVSRARLAASARIAGT